MAFIDALVKLGCYARLEISIAKYLCNSGLIHLDTFASSMRDLRHCHRTKFIASIEKNGFRWKSRVLVCTYSGCQEYIKTTHFLRD